MRVLPESFALGGSGRFELSVQEGPDTALLRIRASDVEDLSHFYAEIEYDNAQWTPLEADSAGLLGNDAIHLLAGDGQGRVQYGELIPGADPDGVDDNGLVATIEFQRRADSPRQASGVPSAAPQLTRNARWSLLQWYYTNPGDYDQNGEVNIADLTPLGINLGRSGPFLESIMEYMVDGDGNGEINISDITPIAVNFGNSVQGYTLYAGVEGTGYPPDPAADNGAGTKSVVELALADVNISPTDRKRFVFTDSEPRYGDRYWVRANSDAQGPASNLTQEWEKQWHGSGLDSYPKSWNVTQPRIEIVDGNPAAAWSAGDGNRRIFYTRAIDRAGSVWPTPLELPGNYSDAWQPELGVVDGRPAISVPLDVSETCMYTISDMPYGGSWSPMVKSSVSGELQFELLDIGGHPLVFGQNGASKLYFYEGDSADATLFTELGWSVNFATGSILPRDDEFLVIYKDSNDGKGYMRRFFYNGGALDADPAVLVEQAASNMRPTAFVEYGGGLTALAAYNVNNVLLQYKATDTSGNSWEAPEIPAIGQSGQFAPIMTNAYGGLMAAWTDVNSMSVQSAFSADGTAGNWKASGSVLNAIPLTERKDMKRVGPHPCMAFVEERSTVNVVMVYIFY